ncbi:SGS-domain-containing protein [Xylariaceae sp. AK1471]|nr:SGS-domain-containing protein [Xylariaceae sp. AK1471]
MSSVTALADAGVQLVLAGKYAEGIEKLTEALKGRAAPLWYLERSKAYLRTNQIDLALNDAEMALRVAYDRANRDQMVEAQLRRAITLYRMGRFADADVCAFWAIRLSDGAKAMEDDGQQNKIDENGDYAVGLKEVQDEMKPNKEDGLATALGSAGRTKKSSMRNQAFTWRIQALTQIEKLPPGHDGRKVHHTSIKYPNPSEKSTSEKIMQNPPATVDAGAGGEKANTISVSNAASGRDAWEKLWSQYHTMYLKHKVRCSFYQTETSLTVDVFLKNLSQGQVAIDSRSGAITISPAQGASLAGFTGSIVLLLFGEIKPEATKYTVKSMKIELVLQKQTPGKWPTLRRSNAEIVDNLSIDPSKGVPFSQFYDFITALGYKDIGELELPDFDHDPSTWYAALLEKLRSKIDNSQERGSSSAPKIEASTLSQSKGDMVEIDTPAEKSTPSAAQTIGAAKTSKGAPQYPTSSKKGPKDWDHIDVDDDEKAPEDADVNSFFQKIYKSGDEDMKRAMMKSFIESNGTALSTSWDDAKSKTYPTQPPDGAEAKKWE